MSNLEKQLERHARIRAVGYDYAAQDNHPVRKCPLCNCAEATTIAGMDRYGHTVESRLCRACALVYLSPRMGRMGYAEFYEKWYRPLVHAYSGIPQAESYAAEQGKATAHSYAGWRVRSRDVDEPVPKAVNALMDSVAGGSYRPWTPDEYL